VDNDGDLDLFCGSYNYPRKPRRGEPDNGDRNEIFLNNGKARFTMVPFSGLGLEATTTSAAVFCDVNNDGKIDLFLGNWYQTYPPMRIRAQGNPLYLGLGHGIFKDVTAEMGLATKNAVGAPGGHRPTYGLSHCDFNNDGWQDLLVCNYGRQANRLWMNVKGEKFVDVGPKVGFDGDAHRKDAGEPPFRQHGNTFAAQCADYDNDGDIDVFLAETTHADSRRRHADASCLLRNRGKEHDFVFERLPLDTLPRAPIARIGEWGDHYAGWLDFDNDGLLDLLVAPSSYRHQVLLLFRQKPDHGFEEIGERAGIRIPDPHGLALADIDRDGDVDILCCSIPRATPNKEKGKFHLFRNDVGNRNAWLVVRLRGSGKKGGSNASAIGARVTVTSGDLIQTREVYGGGGHNTAQDSLELEFGFGKRKKIDRIEVRWPNKAGAVQAFTDIQMNRYVVLTEGKDAPLYE
ncbi:MAG: CRTAC1 family protein, partial [Planctomycetota bacterium]